MMSVRMRLQINPQAVCCSVLQCVAVCCSVLQCVAVRCSALQCVTVRCSVLQCVAVRWSVLQCVAVCCSVYTDRFQNDISENMRADQSQYSNHFGVIAVTSF